MSRNYLNDSIRKTQMQDFLSKLGLHSNQTIFTFYGTGLTIHNPSANTVIIDGNNIGLSTSDTISVSGLPLGIHHIKLEK